MSPITFRLKRIKTGAMSNTIETLVVNFIVRNGLHQVVFISILYSLKQFEGHGLNKAEEISYLQSISLS